jgi:hypothetical protein
MNNTENDIATLPLWAQDLIARYEKDVSTCRQLALAQPGDGVTIKFSLSPKEFIECAVREFDGKRVLDIQTRSMIGTKLIIEEREHGDRLWLRIEKHQDTIAKLEASRGK